MTKMCRGGYHIPSGYCRDYHKEETKMSEEELLLKRIKVIGDGEFTLLGTPDELIKELHSYTQEKCREAKISILGGVKILHRDTRTEIVSIVDGAILPIDERIAELQAQLNKSKGE